MTEKVFDFNTHPLTSRLQNVKSAGQNKWIASCPCGQNHKHGDKNQSLSVAYDPQREKLLVYCFTGCTVSEICAAVGCSVADLFTGRKNPADFLTWYAAQNGLTFVEAYSYNYGPYKDDLYKVRFVNQYGEKDFRWTHGEPKNKSGFAMRHSGTHRLYVAGNIDDDVILLVEGEKDADTVRTVTGYTAVSAEDGASKNHSKWKKEYTKQLSGKTVYILWDNDEVGKTFAAIEANALHGTAKEVYLLDLSQHWPMCPEKGDITDYLYEVGPEQTAETIKELMSSAEPYTPAEGVVGWDDTITKDYPPETIDPETGEIITGPAAEGTLPDGGKIYQAKTITPAAPDPSAPWDHIETEPPLPEFPLHRFPDHVREHIEAFAKQTGVNKDYCAAAVLGTVSAVTVGHVDILFNNHREPIQLYTVFVGSSGSYKSSVIKHFLKPANEFLRRANNDVKKHNKRIKSEITDLENEIKTKKKKAKDQPDDQKIKEIEAQIEEKKKEYKSNYPVPWDDVTPESLVNAMQYSCGAANIATAEGNIINVICGRSYTQRGAIQNIDVFLKAYDGEPIHQNRVTSGEIDIERADLSMLISLQPALLERLCNSADAVGRGLDPRFLIFAPQEKDQDIDHTIDSQMEPTSKWSETIGLIAFGHISPMGIRSVMALDDEADKIIRQFWNYEAEVKRQRGRNDNDSITSWLSKMHGKALRVAAILALLNNPNTSAIRAADAENAVALFKEYFIPHFIAAHEDTSFFTREDRQIIGWIIRSAKRTGKDTFKERDLMQHARQLTAFKGKRGQENLRETLGMLVAHHYIRPGISEKSSTGRGPAARTWQINPELLG